MALRHANRSLIGVVIPVIASFFVLSCFQNLQNSRIVEIDDPVITPETYTINADAAEGGTISISPAKETYERGEMLRISAVPDMGWHFVSWDGTEPSETNPLIFRIVDDEWLIPVFERDDTPPEVETFSIRVDAASGGGVSVVPSADSYNLGELVCVTALSVEGYHFVTWKGTKTSPDNPLVFEVDGNEWLIPEFEADETPEQETLYTVRIASQTGGSVAISPEQSGYRLHEQVMLTATPDTGYSFSGWGGTESGTANPMILTVTDNEWLIPSFTVDTPIPEPVAYTLRVDQSTNGTVTIDPEKISYAEGEYVKVSAIANSGYLFTGWTGTTGGTQNPMVIKMSGDEWLIPQFKAEQTYQVITDRNPVGGTVMVNPDKTSDYRYGDQCILTANPAPGYQFDGWSGDFSGTQRSVFITFDRKYNVQASFSMIPVVTTYTVLATAGANGSITLEPNKASYYENEVVRVTAVPSSGFMLEAWSGAAAAQKSLSFDLVVDGNKNLSASFMQRRWTHLIYMAADNNLDSQALNDINEMEAATTAGKAMNVIVLVDRKAGNGDWSDTRLYEIAQDPSGNAAGLTSQRLSSSELGISANIAGELDLSSRVNLERFIAFAKRAYAADNYTLTIWGHGTGWRGDSGTPTDGTVPMKAVAVDDTSGSYMTVAELGNALSGEGLSVIGFDTCFGSLIEVSYELRDCGSYFVGSEGPTKETGWDYAALFNSVSGSSTATNVCDAIITQFSASYPTVENATISAISLSSMSVLQNAFNSWASAVAALIDKSDEQDAARNALFDATKLDAFWFVDTPSDYYADIYSLAGVIQGLVSAGDLEQDLVNNGISTLNARYNALISAVNTAVTRTWSKKYGSIRKQIGIFVIGVNAAKVPLASPLAAYTIGSGSVTSEFVNDSPGWVPNMNSSIASVLNRVFYNGI